VNYRPGDDRPLRFDPYAAPAARIDDAPSDTTAAERIRSEHLRHEGRLQSVAWLYWFAAAMFVLMAGSMGVLALTESREPLIFVVVVFYLALATGLAIVGVGFRRLRPWVRIPGGILSGLGLLGIPIGTLINGYILFLMFGAKGQRVFAPDYADIRAQTPHLRFRRSTGEKVAMVAVVVVPVLLLTWWANSL
jgi:hypothetical protein